MYSQFLKKKVEFRHGCIFNTGGVLKVAQTACGCYRFGTVYSGYAYSFKYEWTKVKINNWGGGEHLSYKTPSVLLLNPDQSFNSFGYQAERKYTALAENGNECKKYFYFQRFKMILRTSLEKVT